MTRSSSLLTCAWAVAAAAQTCYYPNGTAYDASVTPCNRSASNSACCMADDICLSNGYCWQQQGAPGQWENRMARWGCTDPTFQDPACPGLCGDVGTTGSVSVTLAIDLPAGYFCCGTYNQSTQLCDLATRGSAVPFTIASGLVIYDRSTGAILSNGSLDLTTNTGSTSPLSSSTSPTSVSLSSSTSPTCTPTATRDNGASGSNAIAIGAGVGVALGVMLLASLAALVVLFRQNRALRRDSKTPRLPLHPPMYSPTKTEMHDQPVPREVRSPGVHESGGVPVSEVPASPFPR